jgi:hypothetical protein
LVRLHTQLWLAKVITQKLSSAQANPNVSDTAYKYSFLHAQVIITPLWASQLYPPESAGGKMSFSYNGSMEAWKPMRDERDAKIRVLELHSLPWYLRWVPRSWELYVPLRASLAWAPLAEVSTPKRKTNDEDVDNATSINDLKCPAKSDTTLVDSSTRLQPRTTRIRPILRQNHPNCIHHTKRFHTPGAMVKRRKTYTSTERASPSRFRWPQHCII